jgi:undecaprenyl diphosphate synthase
VFDKMRKLVGLGPAAIASPETHEEFLHVPRHVGVIMDGNGRWASKRGLPRSAGHRAGVEALRRVVEACPEIGIEVLTAYAFSTENWKRSKDEVDFLMYLLVEYCRREVDALNKSGVRINAIGRIHELPALQREEIQRAMDVTRHNKRLVLNLAINYGGRAELVDAVKAVVDRVLKGEIAPVQIDEALIASHLYTTGLPDLDLVIRTAGEMRLSNFLPWQASYSEFWVTDLTWPDIGRAQLESAVRDYSRRERRFGAVEQQSR